MKIFPKTPWLTLFLILLVMSGEAQKKLATLTVSLDRPTSGLNIPASYNLDDLTKLKGSRISLVEVSGTTKTPVAFQISTEGGIRKIYWMVEHTDDGAKSRTYNLMKAKKKNTGTSPGGVDIVDKDESKIFMAGGQDLLTFKYGIQKLPATYNGPENKRAAYERGGFIHPLKSPKGQVLTRIQAPDHWHHYGVWNPWTHAHVEGSDQIIDFWNIGDGKGTMRVDGEKVITEGPVFAELKADLSALVLNPDRSIKTDALGEEQTMRVYTPQNKQSYIFDFTTDQTPRVPFTVVSYRYQGLSMRATPEWNDKNSEMITSEGLDVRSKINGTRARWCIVQGMTGDSYAGVLFLSYPENRGFPEPMRVWDEKATNTLQETGTRGPVYFNFNPAMTNTDDGNVVTPDWPMEVGKTYQLKYRMIVYTDKFTPEMAESAWQYFAKPAVVTVGK